MSLNREKVVVAMSGGVDSSVAACLLVEQGYEVIGLFMRVGNNEVQEARRHEATPDNDPPAATEQSGVGGDGHASPDGSCGASARPGSPDLKSASRRQGCCSASDAGDARFVAGLLDISFYALNFEKDFDRLIRDFADEYARGRTPNPCVQCNDRIKFGRLFEYADAVGARYVATGHYARIDRQAPGPRLLRGLDRRKDQSYVLFGLRREVLPRILFPVGGMTKDQVRQRAARYNLPNRDKPDSVEICFVPDRDYARVVRDRRPDAFSEGQVVDSSGRVLGRHEGIAHYTIGQRRGLGIALGRPAYVTRLDVLNNRVVLGDGQDLLSGGLLAEGVNLLSDVPSEFRAQVKIRYLHEAVPANVFLLDESRARVIFDQPQRAVTPGQAVVFYDGDRVLGGAWIHSSLRHSQESVIGGRLETIEAE